MQETLLPALSSKVTQLSTLVAPAETQECQVRRQEAVHLESREYSKGLTLLPHQQVVDPCLSIPDHHLVVHPHVWAHPFLKILHAKVKQLLVVGSLSQTPQPLA